LPNLYITPAEVKDVAPDVIRSSTTKYDDAMLRMAQAISRAIDAWTGRHFFPRLEARYFTASDGMELWVDDLISITSVKADEDGDRTYETTWASTDYDLRPHNALGSYHKLTVTPEGNNAFPTRLERAVEITGVWGFVDDRGAAWEDSTDEVEDDPLAAADTSITVNDVDGKNLYGIDPRFYAGLLCRLGSEYTEITAVAESAGQILTAIRGVNGTTAAEHVQNTQIDIWRPPANVGLAAQIMAIRQYQRASQHYADARANPEIGQLMYTKKMDPEAAELLEPYRRLAYV
jgi:hypothetical protein